MAKSGMNNLDELNHCDIELNSHAVFVINLPDSRSLRVISRSMFLVVVLLALPSISSIIVANSYARTLYDLDTDPDQYTSYWIENLLAILDDLVEKGVLRKGHKGFLHSRNERRFEGRRRGSGHRSGCASGV